MADSCKLKQEKDSETEKAKLNSNASSWPSAVRHASNFSSFGDARVCCNEIDPELKAKYARIYGRPAALLR